MTSPSAAPTWIYNRNTAFLREGKNINHQKINSIMGKLTINSKHSDSSFEYTEGSYKLGGNAQSDTDTSVMTQFNATVFKTTDGTYNAVGSVSTNYDQSRGDDGLSYNFYNMGLDDIIATAAIVKTCAEALAANEATETKE